MTYYYAALGAYEGLSPYDRGAILQQLNETPLFVYPIFAVPLFFWVVLSGVILRRGGEFEAWRGGRPEGETLPKASVVH